MSKLLMVLVALTISSSAFAIGPSGAQQVRAALAKSGKQIERAVTVQRGSSLTHAMVHVQFSKTGNVWRYGVDLRTGKITSREMVSGLANRYQALKVHNRGDGSGETSGYRLTNARMTQRGNVAHMVFGERKDQARITVLDSRGKLKTDARTGELRMMVDPSNPSFDRHKR